MPNKVNIVLTKDEAWVLFEFVRRFSDSNELSIEDQAEQRALWNFFYVLEKTLHQTSDADYKEFIEQCRARLRYEV